MEAVLGTFTFSSNFEGGNLAKVLPIHLAGAAGCSTSQKSQKSRSHDNHVDYEFNLWTRPDCGGTEFENNNRTWFCFCIKGGMAGEKVQLSVMNLNKQSKLYSQGMQPVVRCVGDCVQSSNWERIKEKCSYRSEDNSTVVSWVHVVPPERRATYYAFTYPYTYTQLQCFLSELDGRFQSDSASLYYHRELLAKSLDGSRLDLVTITSHHGMQSDSEDRITGLFPDWSCPRPRRFKGKKVVFLSARVHPGETPSSFVLNGFINFIISSDEKAKKLRDTFVFKIIPMLNPDGVIRGHYRTDQRGVNLNRVYSNPSPQLHPTIYAAKKMILYYHYGSRSESLDKVGQETSSPRLKRGCEESSLQKSNPPLLDEDTCHSFSDAVIKSKPLPGILAPPGKSQSILDTEEPSVSGWDCSSNMSADSSCRAGSLQNTWDEIQEESNKLDSSGGETGMTSMFGSMSPLHDFKLLSKDSFKTPAKNPDYLNLLPEFPTYSTKSPFLSAATQPQSDVERCKPFEGHQPPTPFFQTSQRNPLNPYPLSEAAVGPEEKRENTLQPPASSFPSPPTRPSSVLSDTRSDLFMYMDFHGHASKRGIFMYGNWFEDRMMMVENLLYPKLLSLNCSNFDFGACNFTERNMYHKDRRDGMSKEGSGRVAVMRATGLIRSYTLECNYNTGRLLGPVPSHGAQTRSVSFHGVPPKYTPATFEDCGHKLGICLYELVNNGDTSKLYPSSSPNLNTLRSELYSTLTNPGVSPRTSTLSSCSVPISSASPKPVGTKTHKDLKPSFEENSSKCKDRAVVPKMKAIGSSPVAKAAPLSVGTTPTPKLPSLHGFSSSRRQSISASVDAENQEPPLSRVRTTKAKSLKGKKDSSGTDASQAKVKKFRYKSTSKKMSPTQSLLFKDLGEASHFPTTEKLSSTKHNLGGTVCLPSEVDFKSTAAEKSDSSKLMKKIEKGRKLRTKTLKFGTKKLKNIATCDASSGSFKNDQFNKVPLKEPEDKIGSPLAIEPLCVSSSNPLSPRSPLASVFEAQTSQSTPGVTMNLKQKSTSFVGSSKSSFHSCPKRQAKTLKTLPPGGDRFSIVPPTTGQRLKLFPKKAKKKVTTGEISGKLLGKPTTSQPPLQWVIRKPLTGSEMDTSNPLNPRVKKRKKSTRKSL